MPPKVAKAATAHDEHTKSDSVPKEKGGHASFNHNHHHHHHHHHTNGKMKRVASSAGSNLREVTNASSTAAAISTGVAAWDVHTSSEQSAPAVRRPNPSIVIPAADVLWLYQVLWSSFERSTLHAYRREYRVQTPTSFADPYHQLVLSQRGSLGLLSPSLARKEDARRQSKDTLAVSNRKHFNSVGIQETEIIAAVLHKVKNDSITKKRKRPEQMPLIDLEPPYPK